ncbi:MAG: hypothetical protein OXN80_05420 [bacterium]|nr:hypothetical protein [bacterium]
MNDRSDELVAEIFGDVHYQPTLAAPKDFKPWHKPRKQFVRRKQWSALLRRLYSQREPDQPLRYLGLPGTDLIDLRYLYEEICRPNDRPLRFLGFNTEAQPGSPAHYELNVSLNEVRALQNVDPQSNVIHDDFRRIGSEESVAWSHVKSLGPFDVVNIDLCDGLASDPPQADRQIYDALARLVAFQSRIHTPWLLFVTTRIGRGFFDVEAEKRLMNVFRKNVTNCEGFAEECQLLLESDVTCIDSAKCNDVDFLILMIAAIGKWLSEMVQAQNISNADLASTHGYRIDPGATCEDLVSLALRFEPVIAPSPDPLSPTPPAPVDECVIAKGILRRVVQRRDVDAILAGEHEMTEELIVEMERLLAQARYDETGYRPWLVS